MWKMNKYRFYLQMPMQNNWLCILALAVLACGPKQTTEVSLPYFLDAQYTPYWQEDSSMQLDQIHQIPDFELTNQAGELVTGRQLSGKIYVANFFFTICPSVCPKMTNNLHRIQEAFGDDEEVMIVSHSVMPWIDSAQVLQQYAERNQIDPKKWLLLTGDKNEIYSLGRTAYFADEGFGKLVTDETDFLHTENIVLVDAQKHIRGIYNGTIPLEMTRLIEDIHRLKKESSRKS